MLLCHENFDSSVFYYKFGYIDIMQTSSSVQPLHAKSLTTETVSQAVDEQDGNTQPHHRLKTFDSLPTERPNTPLLDNIDSPADLKSLNLTQLETLADELREFLLYSTGQSGGHFGANLGVVELTIALHYLLNTPQDQLIWDVGHQAYPHKILTGRREQMVTIRGDGGLTAFPERDESIYDTFGVGHSSTAISAGLGMALALRHQGKNDKVVCVVGDGAMTGGMAFEAMNDAVQQNADLMVILNDNDMSISHATGGFSQHLLTLWQAGYQIDIDEIGQAVLCPRPDMPFAERQTKVSPCVADNLFKAIGFSYFGPFDGHNLPELIRVLQQAKQVQGCVLVHICTTKGKGFLPAENDRIGYHAISKINKAHEKSLTNTSQKKYSQVFGEFLCDKASEDPNLMAITPAMAEGSGMVEFAKQFPKQFFDVAIAEQHAVTLAGGMATQGVKPIVAIYSTFLQRGYDQLIHDVALQNLDVMFAIDRAGLVGEDGATHAGVFDLAYMRCVPNIVIATPKDENECYNLLNTCYEYQGVTAVRYPRGTGTGAIIEKNLEPYSIGKAVLERIWNRANEKQMNASITASQQFTPSHKKIALLAFGSMVETANQASNLLSNDYPDWQISVYNMRFVKPLDIALLDKLLQEQQILVTLEEHQIMGGAGSAVNEYILSKATKIPRILNLGIPDKFIAHGSHAQQLARCGLDVAGVIQHIQPLLH